jgi:hypothetical protein
MRGRLVLGLTLLAMTAARAEFQPDSARLAADLSPEAAPAPVTVEFFMLDVTEVNGASERFSASIYLNLKWRDSRLAFDVEKVGAKRVLYPGSLADEQLQQIWSPAVDVTNLAGEPQIENKNLTIYADGSVEYETRLIGEFSSPMTLRGFPFDTQRLRVDLESFLWNASEVRLVEAEKHPPETLAIRDWKFISLDSRVAESRYARGGLYSRFTAELVVRREPWFYMWGVVFPLVLITFFAVTCFFWDQEALSERVAQTLTCLLTVTAQNLAVSGDLPKISYFTRIDYAFLLTYAILLVVAVESTFVKFFNERDSAKADHLDLTCAWAVPLVYTIGMIAIFWVS